MGLERARAAIGLAALAAAAALAADGGTAAPAGSKPAGATAGALLRFRPTLASPEFLAPFLKDVAPGNDAFADEREAAELQARLDELAAQLRRSPAAGADSLGGLLLAPDFRGGRLAAEVSAGGASSAALRVERSDRLAEELALDARGFTRELRVLLEPFRALEVVQFEIPSLAVSRDGPQQTARARVRYDFVGPGRADFRVQRTGVFETAWRRDAGAWRVTEWRASAAALARAPRPVFTEVTETALGANESFRRQLTVPLDAWSATLDSVVGRDSNGHHGVSVGDADGDGLEDLYVSQPAGLPNRLYRARGDSTFEDWTERSGLAVLDDTAQSLFADVDNDGDQDLVLATGVQPLLFANDGRGRFARVADAFRFDRPLSGSLTGIAMADYDRDGFLDLYLCVYSYFYGAGEDKAGTPMPYHDARNGPPAVLFRNDGRGRFVDATREAGLEASNDRYHFAAAWADYDEDGWPDLLVANDFGAKNLYRNLGRRDGKVAFEDVAERASALDHGAGMSATFLDYDNDGRLDIYTGNMWTAPGLRVTASDAFMKDAPAEVRALYRRHARGNSLLRNLGDGRFEDVSLAARAELGRWAWSSDALDFDADGFDDLYVANGMLTREGASEDLEGFFWRQVVARSPLARSPGTPYDDAWRAINQLLIQGGIAGRQRNVLLRNDGRGGFDDVAGAAGLDLDQDGRSFAVLDYDRDGDPDLAVMAARQAPQLRVFRNDAARGASLALSLNGREGEPQADGAGARGPLTPGNRDAVGARVTVQAEGLTRTRVLMAGSGFLSQHSRTLVFGLGERRGPVRVTVDWPSGRRQTFDGVTVERRYRLVEGGELAGEAYSTASSGNARSGSTLASAAPPAQAPAASWLYEPFPAPDFSVPDLSGATRTLGSLRGRPALLLFWTADARDGRAALDALAAGRLALERAGVGLLAVALDPADQLPRVRAAAAGSQLAVAHATRELALSYAVVNRHLFMNRQDLVLPTAFLLDAAGRIVKAYRGRVDPGLVAADAAAIEAPGGERLARTMPFGGELHAPPGVRNYLPYGRELLDQGLEPEALAAFERAAQASPTASTLYRLGVLLTKAGRTSQARVALERALALKPDFAEASNDLGTLLAQQGDLGGALERFAAALAAAPDYPDALNNLGYALLVAGREQEARGYYEKALALSPDFPEALNNLGLLYGRNGELETAERYFRDAAARRSGYAEATNNLALVLVARGRTDEAVQLLERFISVKSDSDGTILTLAKIYLSTGRREAGLTLLRDILQRNPNHMQAREILAQFQ